MNTYIHNMYKHTYALVYINTQIHMYIKPYTHINKYTYVQNTYIQLFTYIIYM